MHIYKPKIITWNNRYNNRSTEVGSSIEEELIHCLMEGMERRARRMAVKESFSEEMTLNWVLKVKKEFILYIIWSIWVVW